jgi:hypothetical protein
MLKTGWILAMVFLGTPAACGGVTNGDSLTTQPLACVGSPGSTEVLATAPGNIDALVSDGVDVYWLDGSHAELRAVPVAGTASRLVATLSPFGVDGECGPPSESVDCQSYSLAVDEVNVYAAGPRGIFAVSKASGATRTLATYDPVTAYVLGPVITGGGSLFWIVGDFVTEYGQPSLVAHIMKLDSPSGGETPHPFLPASEQVDTASILTADAVNLYWLSGGIRATRLAGGPTMTVISSESLAVENMAVAGDRLVWANQMMGGGCVCPGPQTPDSPELVESVPLTGGSSASLVRLPGDVDPELYVLGDSRFSYVVEAAGTASSIVAIPPSGGAATPLVDSVEVDIATSDSCSIYFSSGNRIERVGKPTGE